MEDVTKFPPEDWRLLRLAGAFNTEQARWNVRRDEGVWQVTRETDEVYPHDVEVMAQCKTNGDAHQARSDMSDIAAARAFLAEMEKL